MSRKRRTSRSGFRFLPPTAMAPTVQVCGKAVGERQEHLNDQCCGHIPHQASQWAPIGHCYNIGWPWGAALRPSLHAPPAPSTWAPPRAPPWPTAGLRVLLARPIFRIKGDPEHLAVQINPRGHSNPQLVWGRPWGSSPEVLLT